MATAKLGKETSKKTNEVLEQLSEGKDVTALEPLVGETVPLIYSRMAQVMSEMDAIVKTKQSTGVNYAFRSIEDVMNALHPILVKNQVFIVPNVVRADSQRFVNNNNKNAFHAQVLCGYTFYTIDGSSIEASFASESVDYSDKATQQAQSYAFKGVLLQSFCIPTKDVQDDGDGKQPDITAKATQPSLPAVQPPAAVATSKGTATPTVPAASSPIPQTPPPSPVETPMTEQQWAKLQKQLEFAAFSDERDFTFWMTNTLLANNLPVPEEWKTLPYEHGKVLFKVAKASAVKGELVYTI